MSIIFLFFFFISLRFVGCTSNRWYIGVSGRVLYNSPRRWYAVVRIRYNSRLDFSPSLNCSAAVYNRVLFWNTVSIQQKNKNTMMNSLVRQQISHSVWKLSAAPSSAGASRRNGLFRRDDSPTSFIIITVRRKKSDLSRSVFSSALGLLPCFILLTICRRNGCYKNDDDRLKKNNAHTRSWAEQTTWIRILRTVSNVVQKNSRRIRMKRNCLKKTYYTS